MTAFFCIGALVLPWLIGGLISRLIIGKVQIAGWALHSGYGYLLGFGLTTSLMVIVDQAGWSQQISLITGGLLLMGGLCAWRICREINYSNHYTSNQHHNHQQMTSTHPLASVPLPHWQIGVVILLIIWLVLRFMGIAHELLISPLYPWDAWSTWAVKARVWFEHRQLVPFVSPEQWLIPSEETFYTIEAWHYPSFTPLVHLWMALFIGEFNEPLINLPWWGCAVALGLASYGQVRQLGMSSFTGVLFVYLLLSLPILNVHTVLAGYADLWLASIYSLATMSLLNGIQSGCLRLFLMSIILALMLPFIKVEGSIWLFTLVIAGLAGYLSQRSFSLLLVSSMLIVIGGLFMGGIKIPLWGVGTWELTPRYLQLPPLGHFAIKFENTAPAFIDNLFWLNNWHLLWYLALVTVILIIANRAILKTDKICWVATVLVLTGVSILFVVFFLTDASQWARNYTSLNRVLLHVVPAWMFCGLLIWQRLIRGSSPIS